MSQDQPRYTVESWGRVYRSWGPTYGIQGVISGLEYIDVCDQIANAARFGRDLRILDQNGKLVSLGHFVAH